MSNTNPTIRSGRKNILTHPFFLVFIAALLAGIGYLIERYLLPEHSDFRFAAQNIEQYIVLSGEQPTAGESNIYCGTFRMRLLLAHNGKGSQNVTIHRISVNVDSPTKPLPQVACTPDPLAGKPAGVSGAESIKLDFDGSKVTARRFLSRSDSRLINADNLLADGESARTVTLKPKEKSVSFDVFVTSRFNDVRAISFEAIYDLNGEKTIRTEPIFLVGPP